MRSTCSTLYRLRHSLKTDRDCLMEDNLGHYRPKTFETAKRKKERWTEESKGPDCLWLDNLYWSSDCGEVPFIRLPMLWFCSPSFHDQQLHTAIKHIILSIVTQSSVIKGEEGGSCRGCRGSVAAHWWLKPEALGSTPGVTTFLSPCCFKGLRTVQPRLSSIRWSLSVFRLWGSPIHQTPHAVILLTIFLWSTIARSNQTHNSSTNANAHMWTLACCMLLLQGLYA